MKKTTAPEKTEPLLWVQILEAKPNKMFTEQMRQSVRFLCYSAHVPCAMCGKKAKIHWTMLCRFKAGDMEKSFLVLQMGKPLPPLTPVCQDHPLGPDLPEQKKKPNKKKEKG